jgi:hypothetical protein
MPGYVRKSLQPNEVLQFESGATFIGCTARYWVREVIALALLIVGLEVKSQGHTTKVQGIGKVVIVAGVLYLILSTWRLIGGILRWKGAEYAVTDRRIIGKYGLGRGGSYDLLIKQVTGVSIEYSLLGKVLGFGDVVINGGQKRLNSLKKPIECQGAIYNQLDDIDLLKGGGIISHRPSRDARDTQIVHIYQPQQPPAYDPRMQAYPGPSPAVNGGYPAVQAPGYPAAQAPGYPDAPPPGYPAPPAPAYPPATMQLPHTPPPTSEMSVPATSVARFCSGCGTGLGADHAFCVSCGTATG